MPPPIPKNDLDRILAWINEFVPPVDAGLSPAALEAQTRNTASFNVPDAPSAPQGRRQDFDDRTVIRLVTELWRETLIGSGISLESDIANNLFLYIARGINEDGRVSGGELLPDDIPGTTKLEFHAFDILRQREIHVDSFPSSGVSGHKLPLKGMMKGALARGLLDAGRISQEVLDLLGSPTIAAGGFSPNERQAATVQRSLDRDFAELLDAARKATGRGTAGLRQAFVNVLTSETPGQIASGESVFKFETPGEVSGEDIDSFLNDKDTFVSDFINRLDPQFNPSTTVDADRTKTLSQAHIREKTRINSLFDEMVGGGIDPADAARELIQSLEALTEEDFQETIQGVAQEFDIQTFSTPEGKKKALKDWAFNEGLDISPNAIAPEALAELQRRIPNSGIAPEFAEALRGIIPVLQQQKSNQDFADQKPEERQGQIGGQLGFGTTTFGTQQGGLTFQTPQQIAQQKALGASQANAAAVIDRQLQQAFAEDPGLDRNEFLGGLRVPGQSFEGRPGFVLSGRDGLPGQGFAQDIPGRIQQIRAEQPSIEGLLPFQVPGSLSEQLQFGASPPTPPLSVGQPTIGGRALGPRGRRGVEFTFPEGGDITSLVSGLSGDDPEFAQFLSARFADPRFTSEFQTTSRELARIDREESRTRVTSRIFDADTQSFVTEREKVPRSPFTTDVRTFDFGTFARGRTPGFRTTFEELPSTRRLRETQRRRKLSRGSGPATFSVFGNRRF